MDLAKLVERVERWLDCKVGFQFNVPPIPEKEIRQMIASLRALHTREGRG